MASEKSRILWSSSLVAAVIIKGNKRFVQSSSEWNGFQQGCGPGSQISGSGSRHLNVLAPAATSRSFSSGFRTIWCKKSEKTTYYLYNSLAPQTISVEPEPNFQAPAPLSKYFGIRFQPSNIACAPTPQPWLPNWSVKQNKNIVADHHLRSFNWRFFQDNSALIGSWFAPNVSDQEMILHAVVLMSVTDTRPKRIHTQAWCYSENSFKLVHQTHLIWKAACMFFSFMF